MTGYMMKKWAIAVGKSRKSTTWKAVQVTWTELVEKLQTTQRTAESYADYQQAPKDKQDAIKDVGGFVGGTLKDGKRQKGHILSRGILCLDIDFAPYDLWEMVEVLYDFTCCLYSTHKHSPETPRYRLVIPLDQDVSEEAYEAISRQVASWIGIEYFDETTYEASRLMYWPSTSCDGEFIFRHQEGPLLKVEEVLACYTDWQDCTQWPYSSKGQQKTLQAVKALGNPAEKHGMVGTFCQVYPISQAIAQFLPHLYTACEGTSGSRYTYQLGSTTGGAVVYEDQYLYSHHGTDPAGGNSLNAFDLVRIHRFGTLDPASREPQDVTKLPSYRAMVQWASEQPAIKAHLLGELFQDVVDQVTDTATIDPVPAQEAPQSPAQSQPPAQFQPPTQTPAVATPADLLEQVPDTTPEPHSSPYLEYLTLNAQGKTCVNTSLLAEHMRQTCHYKVVRKEGFDQEILYWYESGHYRLISPNEFKGRIKKYIPREIRRPIHWEDTYRELMTDQQSVKFEELDQLEDLINVQNGLYHIPSGTLLPHTPKELSTIQLNCTYDPQAPQPEAWLQFIQRLTEGDEHMACILQEWFGLTLSNIPGHRTKKCLGLVGTLGNTGKTQYNNMLDHIIGRRYICATPIQDYEKNFGLGDIYGAKAILIDDQSSATIHDSSNFKKLTGGGLVNCEMKGRQGFPYLFRGTLTFGCNDLPYFKDDKGDHLFERFIVIPCDNVIPKAERRGDILERFKAETDGIFLWAMAGLHRLIANNYQFTPSARSQKALADYIGLNDSFYRFLMEYYELTGQESDRLLKKDIDDAYFNWTQDNDVEPIKRKNLAFRAAKHGIKVKKSNHRYYTGLQLKK